MCRYAFHRYREQYACFACRRCFKIDGERNSRRCPACGKPMTQIGREFKAPGRGAASQWRKVELILQAGITFGVGHCGCGGCGYRAKTLAEMKQFVAAARCDGSRTN